MVLNDGTVIPTVGFGVFQIPNDGSTYRAVRQALEIGYRHIDTAAAYFNEAEVGQAVRESGIPREEIFVTSKLWLQDHGYEAAKAGIQASLDKLGLGYIDLYLIHQPYGDVPGAWKAMEEAKTTGKLHAIGVSNMTPKIWNTFVPQFTVQPAVNQVEFNPFFQQRELRSVMAQEKTKLEAYFPLGHGSTALLTHPVVTALGEKYRKTAGQILLRFEVQEGASSCPSPPIPSTWRRTWRFLTSPSPRRRWISSTPWTPARVPTTPTHLGWQKCFSPLTTYTHNQAHSGTPRRSPQGPARRSLLSLSVLTGFAFCAKMLGCHSPRRECNRIPFPAGHTPAVTFSYAKEVCHYGTL
jgi:diketogulonate reductase-like aldo/keto reductase